MILKESIEGNKRIGFIIVFLAVFMGFNSVIAEYPNYCTMTVTKERRN